MKSVRFNPLTSLVTVAALAIGLAACGGSSTTPEPMPPPPPPPHVCEAGPSQACVDARMEELAALGSGATVAERDAAVKALADARMALADMQAAEIRQGLVDAAMCTDGTEACLAAHNALVAALADDLADLQASGDATNAQEQAAQAALDAATMKRDAVQMALADANRDTATGMAVTTAETAAGMLEADPSPATIMAAEEAIAAAEEAIGDSGAYSAEIEAAKMAVARAKERNTVDAAVMAAETAVSGLASDADGDAVAAVQALLSTAKMAVDGNSHLTDAEETMHARTIALLQVTVDKAQARVDDEAEKDRMAEEEAEKTRNAAMMATALKLHKGLEHGLGDTTNVRTGASDADGVISVTIGTDAAVPLAEDKKTMVADNHGWKGKRHTAEPDAAPMGTLEAMVYSNVGDPEEGNPFNEEYTLNADGETGDITALTGYVTGRVASSNFDQSAGAKQFDLPTNTVRVMVAGTYHGVSGTYYCTPTSATVKCSATIAESGFTLGGGTWSFKPTTATNKVMSVADTVYASYGWWLHKSEDGNTYTASAFATARGTPDAATGIDTLRGAATYTGGAAGKYALYSSTGGTNDAGHFTAKATLEADFNADMVTGTIDEFMGADGESRNWSVELKKSGVAAGGAITGSDGTGDPMETVWTIDGDAADAAGQWSGTLYDNGDDGVPKVGTGTFHSEYSTSGRMVGAFGVNKQ